MLFVAIHECICATLRLFAPVTYWRAAKRHAVPNLNLGPLFCVYVRPTGQPISTTM